MVASLEAVLASILRLDAPRELREKLLARAVQVAASAAVRHVPEVVERDASEDGYWAWFADEGP
eukprot:13373367-Alexandrium_andersonii.AAC.1